MRDYDPTTVTLILAHLRRDVRALNDMARAKLVERGLVEPRKIPRCAHALAVDVDRVDDAQALLNRKRRTRP